MPGKRADIATASDSRPSRGRYSPEEIERGLVAVAICGGNTHRAHRELKGRGVNIGRTTLRKWATDSHVERYEKIRREVIPQIHDRMAQESEDLAGEYAVVERKVLERVEEELPNLKPGEAAGAARNLATSRAISTDKALLLRGRPTEITERRTPEEIIRKLKAVGVLVDGTAEELPPAEQLAPADDT